MLNQTLERLRALHPSHKIKIIAGVGAVSLAALAFIWTSSIKQQFTQLDAADVTGQPGSVLSASNHVTLEYTELKDKKRYVYFKVQNPTNNILNFSKPENITFRHKSGTTPVFTLTDRQQSAFPVKILSNTVVYGVAVFDQLVDTSGDMVFDNLYFDDQPTVIFKESIFVDFGKLKTIQELRS